MELTFKSAKLKRLLTSDRGARGLPSEVIRAYRRRIWAIRAAVDERDLYAMKSLRFEKLKGKRSRQRSMRLNDQWRLVVEIKSADSGNEVLIVGIEDYH